jgi:hypothetical protein
MRVAHHHLAFEEVDFKKNLKKNPDVQAKASSEG